MALGPGKYDDLCTTVREAVNADCAIVIVMGGDRGSGFSIQAHALMRPEIIADILEVLAIQLKESE